MPWFKVDDTMHSHPKARRASLAAMGLWTLCGTHSMAYKLDGFVPEWVAHGYSNGKRLAAELVLVGLWGKAIRTDDAGDEPGYQFHDWLHYQQSAEEIERDRQHNRERQRNFRKRLREGKPKEGE